MAPKSEYLSVLAKKVKTRYFRSLKVENPVILSAKKVKNRHLRRQKSEKPLFLVLTKRKTVIFGDYKKKKKPVILGAIIEKPLFLAHKTDFLNSFDHPLDHCAMDQELVTKVTIKSARLRASRGF